MGHNNSRRSDVPCSQYRTGGKIVHLRSRSFKKSVRKRLSFLGFSGEASGRLVESSIADSRGALCIGIVIRHEAIAEW